MKTMLMVVCLSLVFAGIAAGPFPPGAAKSGHKLTPEERQRLMLERTGGMLEAPATGKGIVLLNCAGLSEGSFGFLEKTIKTGLMFPLSVRSVSGSPAIEIPTGQDGFIVKLVDDAANPLSLTIAPENGAALVNVAVLKKDAPSQEKLNVRIYREVWRALIYGLGGGNTENPKCLMKTVTGLDDLDALQSSCPSPEVFNRVIASAAKFGVKSTRVVTYRKACAEGWAPAPTNDVQKAIWEKVHTPPEKPLKITYDKAAQKPVVK